MFRPKKTTAPAKKVWRISESAPMGEWVNEVTPVAPKPNKDLPEVSHGPWVRSSYDLLDGTDVTEDPDALPRRALRRVVRTKAGCPKEIWTVI